MSRPSVPRRPQPSVGPRRPVRKLATQGAAAGHTAAVAVSAGRGAFVGRRAELADVRARLAEAAGGEGGLVLVSGQAGIGKTRLVEEAVRDAGVPTVWGRCVDEPGAPPLWPWLAVARAVPGLDVVLSAAEGEPPTGDPASARFRLVASAAEALLASAGPDGLAVVLEDLHWADDPQRWPAT